MTPHWYEPRTCFEILKRSFSFLNMVVLIFTATVVFSELRFDWVEKLAGSYLALTNESRPEKGAIWETGRLTASAHESLDRIISKKEDTRQTVHQATRFSSLAANIVPGEWVTLEKHQFKALYLALEKTAAEKIIEPGLLIWLLNGSPLDRIFCEGIQEGIKIYFIDSENRVLKEIDLKKEDILEIESGEKPVPGRLSDMEGFSGRIYPAKNYFEAMFRLPADIIPDLMVNPRALLRQEGKIVRVGIWNESKNGYITLGFEFEEKTGSQVVFVNGREWAVWQLSLNLKGEGS